VLARWSDPDVSNYSSFELLIRYMGRQKHLSLSPANRIRQGRCFRGYGVNTMRH
jgi:hypothetical protein